MVMERLPVLIFIVVDGIIFDVVVVVFNSVVVSNSVVVTAKVPEIFKLGKKQGHFSPLILKAQFQHLALIWNFSLGYGQFLLAKVKIS